VAEENHLPCIYLVDSVVRFADADEVFPDADDLAASLQSSAYVGQRDSADCRRDGSCTAGGAYVPAMSDETVTEGRARSSWAGRRW
jgi:acetyl-CoA carboxylase carboxyltransferase component